MAERSVLYGRTDSWENAAAALNCEIIENYGTVETNANVDEALLVQYTVDNDASVIAEVLVIEPGPKRRKQIVFIYSGFTET